MSSAVMTRVNLQPFGRFAFLVVGAHALIGSALWWWMTHAAQTIQGSATQNLVWLSPADFTQAVETTTAVKPEPPKPAPKPKQPEPAVVAKAPEPPPQPKEEPKPAPPMPASIAAVSAEAEDDNLPKAIAIDPAKAAEIMAKARAAEAAAASQPAPAPAVEPKPAPPPESKPTPKPEPPKPQPKIVQAPAPKVESPSAPREMRAPTPPDEPKAPETKPSNESSRFVTVSHPERKKSNKPMPQVATLLDAALFENESAGAGSAKGVRLEEVDRAIIQAFMREWVAPDATKLGLDQRTVSLDVRIARDGQLLNYALPRRSGSDELDLSVLEAADRLGKIDTKLPASYRRDVYEFQVNFHVE